MGNNEFINECSKLAKSFRYRLDVIGHITNKIINERYISITNQFDLPREEWKYYKNMNGDYHEVDDINFPLGLKLITIEDGTEITLTKTTILDYPLTRKDIINEGEVYKTLLATYNDATMLINGIVNPVDISIVLEEPDGFITSYNNDLVESNEWSLINDIEVSLVIFLERWNVEDYALIDELYVSLLIKDIAHFITMKIHNIRLGKTGTGEAHSFHVNEHFKSNMAIDTASNKLPQKERIWLYRHLKYLMANVGKQDSLDLLLENVVYPNNMSVREYKILINNPKLNSETLYEYDKPTSITNRNKIYGVDQDNNKNNVITSDILISMLNNLDKNNDNYLTSERTLIENLEEVLRSSTLEEPTKLLTIGEKIYTTLLPVSTARLTLDNWFKLILVDNLNTKLKFKDENTGVVYNLTSKQAMLLTLKLIMVMTDTNEILISKLNVDYVLNPNVTNHYTDVPINIKNEIQTGIDHYINVIPDWSVNSDETVEGINSYLKDLTQWYYEYYMYSVGSSNNIESNFYSLVLDRIREQIELTLSPTSKTIDVLLIESGVVFVDDTKRYDYRLTLRKLVETFTGVDIDQDSQLSELLNSYREIIDKLTSYTILPIVEEATHPIPITSTGNGILRGLDYFSIERATSKCLEYFYGDIEAILDNDPDQLADCYLGVIHLEREAEISGEVLAIVVNEDKLSEEYPMVLLE